MSIMGKPFRMVFAVMLVLLAGRGYGQETLVPAAIQVPVGSKLLLHVYGHGVQVYVCSLVNKDPSRYAWTFVEARATLYTTAFESQKAGRHYFDAAHHPVWETMDGASVTGAKLQQVDARDPGDIPWLLLKANAGNGSLAPTAFVQRINTKGGTAPAAGADAGHKGATIEVAYNAEYLFYAN